MSLLVSVVSALALSLRLVAKSFDCSVCSGCYCVDLCSIMVYGCCVLVMLR